MTEDLQWNPEILRTFVGVPWNPRGITTDPPLEEFANVTSRELWCKHMEQQTDALPVKAMDKSMCQGVGNGLRTSLTKRNSPVNHVKWCSKMSLVVQLNKSYQEIDHCVQMEQESQQHNAPIPEPSAQPSSSSHEEPMQVSTTSRRARIPEDESMSALISGLCERDVLEIDWEKLAVWMTFTLD